MFVKTKDQLAKIAISKNVIKEYETSKSNRTVYLDNGTEFQVYLKNPYQYHLGIKIYMNDQSIGDMLVLKPGQSYWLDRFINNNHKFLFSTYEIEDNPEMNYAVSKNGVVKVEFFKEKEQINIYNHPFIYNSSTTIPDFNLKCASEILPCASNISYNTLSLSNQNINVNNNVNTCYRSKKTLEKTSQTKETGRIEKGSKSNQSFTLCDINFEYSPFSTENIQILPRSQKQIHTEDIRRKYCSQCGKKVGPKDRFCSNCGTKLN